MTLPTQATDAKNMTIFSPQNLNELAKRLTNAMPSDIHFLKSDLEKTFHAILQSSLSKLNLVSREELEVQQALLARLRAQLEQLESKVTDLETLSTQAEENL